MSTRKGIVLAGGANTRLYPVTYAVPKSLLPIYDKPLIYYPLSALMLAGIRDILIITTPHGEEAHRRLLGNGEQFGLRLHYRRQEQPRGIADAFLVGGDFIDNTPCALLLSDNIHYGGDFVNRLQTAAAQKHGATIFARQVPDPQRFGVVDFDDNGQALSLEEKPQQPKSSYAVTGCYFYDQRVGEFAASLNPSARGELEITDLNRLYLSDGSLTVQHLGSDCAWFDTGTADSLADAADFVRGTQKQQGLMISCLEEIAWRQGWLDDSELRAQAEKLGKTPYGEYLLELPTNR